MAPSSSAAPSTVGRTPRAFSCISSSRAKPNQNAYVESFNGRLRDECLNEHWFLSLADVRDTVEAWRLDYNGLRPHSSLGNVPPAEFEQLTLNREVDPIRSP